MCEMFWYYNPFSQKTPKKPRHINSKKKKKIRHRPQLCVNMWERTAYFLIQSRVVSGLSYKPVKTDLDGAPWLSLNDPLTAQGVLVVARPPGGKNDTRWPWVVAPTGSWKVEKSGRRSTVKIKAAAKSKAELLFFFVVESTKSKCEHHILHGSLPFHLSPVISSAWHSPQCSHNYEQCWLSTFTLGNKATPHHLAFLQMACDGVSSLSLDKAFFTHHRDGAP